MYRPIVLVPHAANFALSSYNPLGYQLLNLGIHCLAATMVYALLLRWPLTPVAAFASGLLCKATAITLPFTLAIYAWIYRDRLQAIKRQCPCMGLELGLCRRIYQPFGRRYGYRTRCAGAPAHRAIRDPMQGVNPLYATHRDAGRSKYPPTILRLVFTFSTRFASKYLIYNYFDLFSCTHATSNFQPRPDLRPAFRSRNPFADIIASLAHTRQRPSALSGNFRLGLRIGHHTPNVDAIRTNLAQRPTPLGGRGRQGAADARNPLQPRLRPPQCRRY